MTPTSTRLALDVARYRTRRREHALLTGQLGSESVRAPLYSLLAGLLLAVLLVVGAGIWGVLRPQPPTADAEVVLTRSGALYLRMQGRWHPVPNLVSAQLIAGRPVSPRVVDDATMLDTERGAPLGIPGAPAAVGSTLAETGVTWQVCDGAGTTVVLGTDQPADSGRLAEAEPVLVVGPGGTTQLLFGGRRARIDRTDPAVLRALRLEGVQPKPVSATLLNALPEAAPITAPAIPGAGGPGPAALSQYRIGDVLRVQAGSGVQYYVLLSGGVQRIGAQLVDLIRLSSVRPGAEIPDVDPTVLARVPTVGVLRLAELPEFGAPRGAEVDVLCVAWQSGLTALSVGAPSGDAAVALASADGDGPGLDAVSMPPGRSLYVRPDGPAVPGGTLIVDTGARFDIPDEQTRTALGLPEQPQPVPRWLLAALPIGPTLDRAAALVAWDVQLPAR